MDDWQGPYAGLQQLVVVWALSVLVATVAAAAIAVIARGRLRRAGTQAADWVGRVVRAVERVATGVVAGYRRHGQPAVRRAWARRPSAQRQPIG